MNDMPVSAAGEFKDGQNIRFLIVAFFCYMFAQFYIYSFGVFIAPVEAEFGWRRSEISTALVIALVGPTLGAPLTGLLVDRFGVRNIGIAGIVVYSGALASIGLVTDSLWSWWGHWTLVSIGVALTTVVVWTAGISMRFTVARGKALAIMLCGAGAASTVFPALANQLIGAIGWRMTYVTVGVAIAAISLLLLLFLLPPTRPPVVADMPKSAQDEASVPLRDVFLSRHFISLAAVAFIANVAILGTTVNFVPILSTFGFERSETVLVAGLIGIGSIGGRLSTGIMLDKFNGGLVGAASFSIPIVAAMMLLSGIQSITGLSVAAFLFGYILGAETDIIAYVASRYFSLQRYGRIMGVLVSFLALGAMIGPTLAAAFFDRAQSYTGFLWFAVVAFGVIALLLGSLGSYPEERAQHLPH